MCLTLMVSRRSATPRAGTSSPKHSLGIATCTASIRTANENALNGVASCLASRATGPCCYGTVEAFSVPPPVWVSAGNVHGQFKAARSRFAKLIAGAQQALSVGCAGVMELDLFRVGLVVGELVLT